METPRTLGIDPVHMYGLAQALRQQQCAKQKCLQAAAVELLRLYVRRRALVIGATFT